MKKLSTLKSNTDAIMGALDTFHTPDREDGICKHCDKYNSELTKDGYCPNDKYERHGGDCWWSRAVEAIQQGKARMLPSGQFVWLQGLE